MRPATLPSGHLGINLGVVCASAPTLEPGWRPHRGADVRLREEQPVVARSADLAEPDDDFRVAAPGSTTDLEEALGAAIARRVREFRLQLGWTVGQLAAQSGMSKGMLSKIETAQASPSLATLARLSEALQVPVTAFFRGLNEEQDVLYVKAGKGLTIEHKWSGAGRRYQKLGI